MLKCLLKIIVAGTLRPQKRRWTKTWFYKLYNFNTEQIFGERAPQIPTIGEANYLATVTQDYSPHKTFLVCACFPIVFICHKFSAFVYFVFVCKQKDINIDSTRNKSII